MTEKYSLEEIIENTRKGFIKHGMSEKEASKLDLSYITQELIDSYEKEAKDKNKGIQGDKRYPCYWGHDWTMPAINTWRYTNGNSSTDCDSREDACGDSYHWRVKSEDIEFDFSYNFDCPDGGMVRAAYEK